MNDYKNKRMNAHKCSSTLHCYHKLEALHILNLNTFVTLIIIKMYHQIRLVCICSSMIIDNNSLIKRIAATGNNLAYNLHFPIKKHIQMGKKKLELHDMLSEVVK